MSYKYKIFRIHTKGKDKWLVVAKNATNAKKIAMKFKMAKKLENIRAEDITKEYLSNHKLKIPKKEGFMSLNVGQSRSKINVIENPQL